MGSYVEQSASPPQVLREGVQQYYNSETFSDVQVLMRAPRPLPSKIARKSVQPVYTFNAHKIVLSTSSTAFAEYFRTHPKDEDTDNVCRVHFDELYGDYAVSREVNVAVLRFLYGLPLLGAIEGGPDEESIDPRTWQGLFTAAKVLGIPHLRTHTLHKLEEYAKRLLVDDRSGLLRDESSILKFAQAVMTFYITMDKSETTATERVLKLCLEHFTELEKHESFRKLTDAHPSLLRDMLGYAARQKAATSSPGAQSSSQGVPLLPKVSQGSRAMTKPSPETINRGPFKYRSRPLPPLPDMFKQWTELYYNSPKLSDVTILVADPRKHSRSNVSTHIRIHAHKEILAAGSHAFCHYFETHGKDTGAAVCEVKSSDLYVTSTTVTTVVLRYLYGLSLAYTDGETSDVVACDWMSVCDAADGFEIPSLRKHAMDMLEATLQGLLNKGISGDGSAIEEFMREVAVIRDSADGEETSAMEVVAKLISRNFAELRKHEAFNDLTSEDPELSRAVLDYAAREGLLGRE